MTVEIGFLRCFFVQNGFAIYDDVHEERIAGLAAFGGLVDLEDPSPLTFAEQYALTEATAKLATACYAGVLMLQAMGLGGWMFDGIDRFSILGASGDPDVRGLGVRYDQDARWSTPNPTWRDGVFEAYCPPDYPDMAAAVEAFAERKFGSGGPFNPETPGAWRRAPGSARAPKSSTKTSKRASHSRRNTSWTPSASSPERCRPSSS